MKKTALTLALTLFIAGATAQSTSFEELNSSDLENYQEQINAQSDQLPGFLSSLIGDQTININIESGDTDISVGAVMNGTKVEQLQMGGYENATFRVNTSEKQIRKITESEEPIRTLNTKLENGEIEYGTEGALNSLKTFIAEQLLTVVSLF